MTLDEQRRQAQWLLDNEILKLSFENARSQAFETFSNSNPDDHETRELAYHKLKAVESLEDEIRAFITEFEMRQNG